VVILPAVVVAASAALATRPAVAMLMATDVQPPKVALAAVMSVTHAMAVVALRRDGEGYGRKPGFGDLQQRSGPAPRRADGFAPQRPAHAKAGGAGKPFAPYEPRKRSARP
jgi:hypothetical protein